MITTPFVPFAPRPPGYHSRSSSEENSPGLTASSPSPSYGRGGSVDGAPPVDLVKETLKQRNLSTESSDSTGSGGSLKRCLLYTDEEIRKMCTDGEIGRLRKIFPEYFTAEKRVYLIGRMNSKMDEIKVWLTEKRNAHPRKQFALQKRYDNIVVCHHYVSNLMVL